MVYQIKHITYWKQTRLTKNPINNKKEFLKIIIGYCLYQVLWYQIRIGGKRNVKPISRGEMPDGDVIVCLFPQHLIPHTAVIWPCSKMDQGLNTARPFYRRDCSISSWWAKVLFPGMDSRKYRRIQLYNLNCVKVFYNIATGACFLLKFSQDLCWANSITHAIHNPKIDCIKKRL